MAAYKPRQHRISISDRVFHFVSYDAVAEDSRRDQPAEPAMWYLMVEGHRRPVFPCVPDRPEEEVEAALTAWILEHALTPEDRKIADV